MYWNYYLKARCDMYIEQPHHNIDIYDAVDMTRETSPQYRYI